MEVKEDPGTGVSTPAVTVTKSEKVTAKFQIGCSDEDFEDQIDEEEQYHVIPPDGGWGWVVVAASFMCNAVVDGIIFTSGMLFPQLRKTFGASNADVAWISSLLGGFYLLVGPFVSAFASAFGFRIVCIVGSIVAASACVLSYFATSIYFLYGSFGVLGGIGFGLIYVPAVISTGFYFERRRALATGIAVCGSGIGTFIMSPVNTYLLNNFGDEWRIIFLVYAGIILTCCFYSLAFRPLSAATGRKVKIGDDIDIAGTPLLLRIKRARVQEMANCASALSMSSIYSRTPSKLTLEESQGIGNGDLKGTAFRNVLDRYPGGNIGNKRISVVGNLPVLKETEHHSGWNPDPYKETNGVEDDTETTNLQPVTVTPRPSLHQVVSTNSLGVKELRGIKGVLDERSRRSSKASLRSEHSRPFYRDDVFYTGSFNRLPQFQSSETLGHYHASVTKMPSEHSIEDDSSSNCCPVSLRHLLERMFDLSLLSSVTFIVLSVTGFMALISLFVPFNFLPSYAADLGIDEGDASFLMSLIGICNTVGRITVGWVSDHPKVDALMVNNLALIIGGTATVMLPFITSLDFLYLYAVVFGLSVAAFASLRSILLVELLGLEKLTNAFGLLLLFQGFAAIFGSPIAGKFVDMTGEYKLCFYVFGAIFAVSGLLCIPLRKIKEWEDKKIDEKLRKEKYGLE